MQSLILASTSPRRREFVTLLGVPFKVVGAEVDESAWINEAPAPMVRRLSLAKAAAVVSQTSGDAWVVGADTAVACDGCILGKPGGATEARDMLFLLRAKRHQVHSGVSIIDTRRGTELTLLATTVVHMRAYSEQDIEAYIESGDPFDKAGGYAVQHPGFQPATAVDGCYACVMGLPLCHLAWGLRSLGISLAVDVPEKCQAFTEHVCTVFTHILDGIQPK